MIITDAQVHVWAADRPDRRWPPPGGRPPPHGAAFLPDDLLASMDSAGIDRAVLVPPSFEGDRNDLCLEAARAHPDRFAVMGRLSMTDPASRDLVPGWLDEPGMLGVRLTFGMGPSRTWLTDGTCDWFWKAAENADIPVMVYPPGELRALRSIASRHPGLRLVIDHLGVHPAVRDNALDPVLDELVTLATLDNVAVKATTVPTMVSEPYPFGSLHARIKRVVDAFGPARVFWGSDLSRLTCTYAEARDLFLEELDFLTPAELSLIMSDGLSAWIGWADPHHTRLADHGARSLD